MLRLGSKEAFLASLGGCTGSGWFWVHETLVFNIHKLGQYSGMHGLEYQMRSGCLPCCLGSAHIDLSVPKHSILPGFYIYDLRGVLEWGRFSQAD